MDWKRTMNDTQEQAKEDKAEEAIREHPAQETQLTQFLEELLPELNLRLLLEIEPEERLLWVESVTLMEYHSAPVKEEIRQVEDPEESKEFISGKRGLTGWISNRLMGLWKAVFRKSFREKNPCP